MANMFDKVKSLVKQYPFIVSAILAFLLTQSATLAVLLAILQFIVM